ncbi:glycosyltransferase family 2 protein [Acaryochloris marina]|uniref:Glycosyl transferase, family 2 n=1 Tax=Acaryochloris marina (strain MBIC 11017) TaxID=329726 RepID=B0C9Z1_ACAM1|nr:glycosyltransferase family 2 protein [Acaryochloris marina]ABW25431.1 glycosyl transferase, family 2 [Acaryochloris marina MBIC11017]
MKIPVSILILTKNEEKDLSGCLESVTWSDDIYVYDAYSSDKTVAIANEYGANVIKNPSFSHNILFGGNESEYRNWGLRNISFQYQWVLQIDADERVTAELAEEIGISVKVEVNIPFVAYRIQRRDFFQGTWLKHVQNTRFYIRLFQPDKIHFERLINPVTIVDGQTGELTGYLDHYPFSKGINHWINRHNKYSSFESREIYESQLNKEGISLSKAIFSESKQVRRFYQKKIFYKLPARPLIKFIILYFFKCGFLDGRSGFTYALLQCFYEYIILLKVNELNMNKSITK